jgi:tetratricopeptide (TPR) repeat protein
VAREIAQMASRGELVLFVGAFVSSRPPSCLPTGPALKWGLAEAVWEESRSALIANLDKRSFRTALRKSSFSHLPLELLVDETLRRSRLEIPDLLSFVNIPTPNQNHIVLARLLDLGAAEIVTTNFDELVELARKTPGDTSRISKIHGTISSPQNLAVRLPTIAQGFMSRRLRNEITARLRDRDVVFVGYSGSDLDVRPVLANVECRSVLWIVRPRESGETLADVTREIDPGTIPRAASIRSISVDVDALLSSLGRIWRVPIPRSEPPHTTTWQLQVKEGLRQSNPWRLAITACRILSISGARALAAEVADDLRDHATTQLDRAEAALQAAEARYRLQQYPRCKADAHLAASIYRQAGRTAEAVSAYEILYLLAERTGERQVWSGRYLSLISDLLVDDHTSLVRAAHQLNLGIWLKNRGRFDEANDALREGLKIARALGDLRQEVTIFHALGLVWRATMRSSLRQRDHDLAIRLARKARTYATRSGELAHYLSDVPGESRALETLIAIDMDFESERCLSRVESNLKQVEQLVDVGGEPQQRALIMNLWAQWYQLSQEPEKADALATDAFEIVTDNVQRASCLRQRAVARFVLGKVDEALADLHTALPFDPKGPSRTETLRLIKEMKAHRNDDQRPRL